MERLQEGEVYRYSCTEPDGRQKMIYWYYRSFLGGGRTIFSATGYEDGMDPRVHYQAQMTTKGMRLLGYYRYAEPEASRGFRQQAMRGKVLSGNWFPFRKTDYSEATTQIAWKGSDGGSRVESEARRFLRDTIVEFAGKKHPALVFEVRKYMQDLQDNSRRRICACREVYAQGIGLVYFESPNTPGQQRIYRYTGSITMEVLESKWKVLGRLYPIKEREN